MRPQCCPRILVFICHFCIEILLLTDLQTHRTDVCHRCRMDCKPAKNQIFLLLSIKESCAAEDCMGSLAALKGRPYIGISRYQKKCRYRYRYRYQKQIFSGTRYRYRYSGTGTFTRLKKLSTDTPVPILRYRYFYSLEKVWYGY